MVDTVNSPYIVEATSDNFQSRVIDNSEKGPVLVNFWSSKAGSCLRLHPVLNQVVDHYDGRLLLVNVDTEKEFVFTKEYGIASVPTLKLFRHGNVMETMQGYQSGAELKKVMDHYVARDSDLILADAIQSYIDGKAREAYEAIASAIVDDPVNPRLPLAVCKLLKHEQRYADAVRLIETLPEKIRNEGEVSQLYDLLCFFLELGHCRNLDSLQENLQSAADDLDVLKQLCIHSVAQQHYEQALQYLVRMMEIDHKFEQDYAQKAMLKIFNILGNADPLVNDYRAYLKRYTH